MSKSNRTKSKFLGLPHGTAWSKLRKAILFQLVRETGRDVCYRCGTKVENINEFSIDHTKPWLGVDPALFWDLANISFSHLSCNIAHARKPARKEGPEETSWCWKCQDFRPIKNFHKNNNRHTGAQDICRPCKRKTYNLQTGKRR